MGRRAFFGLLIVAIGVLYLLKQMGVFHFGAVWLSGPVLWPWVMVLLGGLGLKEFGRGRIPWTSLFFIVLGVFWSLQATGYFLWLNRVGSGTLFWSLVIIFVGASLIFPKRWRASWGPVTIVMGDKRSRRGGLDSAGSDRFDGIWGPWKPRRTRQDGSTRSRGGMSDHRWIGDLSIGRQPWVLKNLDLWNGIGDVRLNLATAHVESGNYEIEIRGVIGDVRVLVPENLAVRVEAQVGVGEVQVFGESESGARRMVEMEDVGYATADRRCEINIALRIGDIEVVRV